MYDDSKPTDQPVTIPADALFALCSAVVYGMGDDDPLGILPPTFSRKSIRWVKNGELQRALGSADLAIGAYLHRFVVPDACDSVSPIRVGDEDVQCTQLGYHSVHQASSRLDTPDGSISTLLTWTVHSTRTVTET